MSFLPTENTFESSVLFARKKDGLSSTSSKEDNMCLQICQENLRFFSLGHLYRIHNPQRRSGQYRR